MTSNTDISYKPVILCIMDGWGLAPASDHNAVSSAHTPCFDHLMAHYPNACLEASGPAVGLPEGQPGNSEVGHMNIGAGRVVLQDLPRIHNAIADGSFAKNPALLSFIENLQKTGGTAHVLGLFSEGGVHAHSDHCAALCDVLQAHHVPFVIHAFTDGRDTLPKVAQKAYQAFQDKSPHHDKFATVIGRYYAMDRDNRQERTKAAFDAICHGKADYHAKDYNDAVQSAYDRDKTDEFIDATILDGYHGMSQGDGVFMLNFRVDRARQIITALQDEGPEGVIMASMTPVFAGRNDIPCLFAPQDLSDGLGETVAKAGLRQYRLAETEKYPHVTYFFNGGEEDSFTAEERSVVPSPKVATYDLAPEMSAQDVLDKALSSIAADAHDLLVINFANPDMVGHTGDVLAARKAVEVVDHAVAELTKAVEAKGGAMIVTADHGNCEVMWDDLANSPHTAHTTNLVPVILVGGPDKSHITDGVLADLAPTLLALLNVNQPDVMTGKSLLNT